MSKYRTLRKSPPQIEIKKDCREVIFTIISSMCDNVHTIRIKKNGEGDFKIDGMGKCLSNFQLGYKAYEIEWKADEGKWNDVIRMINNGTSVIEKAVSR